MNDPRTRSGPTQRVADQVEALLLDQRERWQRGDPVLVEDYILQLPALSAEREALLDLVYAEYCLRIQAGQTPQLAEYQRRFPQLRDDLQDQFEVHHALASAEPATSSLPFAPELPTTTVTLLPVNQETPRGLPDVPGYEMFVELGRGAMGVVYKARHQRLNRIVALKMILAAELAHPGERARVGSEALALASVQHPNIVQIFELGEYQGQPFLALEYCPGGSLADYLRGTPLPPRQAAELTETLARAIHHAHEQGVIHRDLKPGNILIKDKNPSGLVGAQPKITDFGLAKRLDQQGRSQTGDVMGTPSYMAPEQAAGRPNDTSPQTDVYALGAILYELLLGFPPFRAPTAWETIRRVIDDEPVAPRRLQPGIPVDLETVCLMCLQKDAKRRYASASAFADDLRRWLDGQPVRARRTSLPERIVKWARRRPAEAATLVVSVVAATFLFALAAAVLQVNLLAEQKSTLSDEVSSLQKLKESSTQEIDQAQRALARLKTATLLTQYASVMGEIRDAEAQASYPQLRHLLDRQLPGQGQEDLRGFEWHYYDRVYRSEKYSLTGHSSLAFDKDGLRFVVVQANGRLSLHDTRTGKEVGSFSGLSTTPTCAVFGSDGTTLAATCRDGKVAFWDRGAGAKVMLLNGHKGVARHITAGPAGLFATCGEDHLKIWQRAKGAGPREIYSLAHNGVVFATAFSPDGKWLLSAGADETARVWDLTGRVEWRKLRGRSGAVSAVAYSPTGTLAAIARMERQKTIEVFETAGWTKVRELHGHTQNVRTLAFSPDGELLVSGGEDGVLRRWNPHTGTSLASLPGHLHSVSSLAFGLVADEPPWLASVGAEGKVKVWDLAGPKARRVIGGHNAAVTTLAFRRDGHLLASGDCAVEATLRVHDLDDSGAKGPLPMPHGAALAAVCFTQDGKSLLAAGVRPRAEQDVGDVRRWAIDSAEGVAIPAVRFDAKSLFAASGGFLAVSSKDSLRVYDAAGKQTANLEGLGQEITALCLGEDGKWVAWVNAARILQVRALPSGDILHTREVGEGPVRCLALNPKGKQLAWSGAATIHLVSLSDKEEDHLCPGHEGPVTGLAFSPDGKRLASCSFDRTVRVWDTFAGRELMRLPLQWSRVNAITFSPDGRRLAVGGGGTRGEVVLYDAVPR